MKKNGILSLALAFFTCSAMANDPAMTLEDRANDYDERYQLIHPDQKLTNNHGEGYEDLYGTRNVRMLLKGTAYRGGANNKWHRSNKRDNRNPLPNDGLENLCEEGFDQAVYLYERNFDKAPKQVTCNGKKLKYAQLSSLHDNKALLGMIYDRIKNPSKGPIYLHCWNGWHASGRISAFTFMQFCDFSKEQAVAYWDRNTDGHNKHERYELIRNQIRNFTPYPEYEITAAEKSLLCPTAAEMEL